MKKTFFLLAFILPVCSVLAQPYPFTPGTVDDNLAVIRTTGDNNVASADQQGDDNVSFIKQTNDGNKAIVTQINPNSDDADNIFSRVKQSGKNNKAFVTQEHHIGTVKHGTLVALINQSGNDNKATQVQGPGSKTGYKTYARINQSGNGNVANQQQLGYRNDMIIKQAGNDGVAKQSQDNGVMGSLALINQAKGGKGNKAYQTQTSASPDWGTSLVALSHQSGDNNKSTQNQQGWVNRAKVNQSGNKNVARQDQVGVLNLATIKQRSNGNTAKQNQSNVGGYHHSPAYVAANVANILQEGGKDNVAHQTQTFVSPSPTIHITGNWGNIYQNGKENKAFQTQDGGNNIGIVIQNGNGNTAHVSQNQSVISP